MRKTGNNNRKKRVGILAGVLMLLLACSGCGKPEEEPAAYTGPETAEQGVWICNHDVSGMTYDQICEVVNQEVAERAAERIYLNANGMSVSVTAGELGLHCTDPDIVDKAMDYGKRGSVIQQYKNNTFVLAHGAYVIDIPYAVDEGIVRSVVQQITPALSEGSGGSQLIHNDDGSFTVIPGDNGMTLDEDPSVEMLVSYMNNEWTGGVGNMTLAVKEGDISKEVEALSMVQDLLGAYATEYDPTEEERSTNIAVGTAKINGLLLYPGQSASVCSMLEPFTEEEGYAAAHSYEQGLIVDSLGGGVCQISTTLYNAILQAELQVDERCQHSMMVGYIAPSLDAAIAENTKDLIFTNNTDAPVYIEGAAADGTISFWIYGHETRDPARTVVYESEILEREEVVCEYNMDSSEEVGAYEVSEPREGIEAQAWKVVYINGEQVSRDLLSKSKYQMAPMIYTIGTMGATAEEVQMLSDAIATDDHDEVARVIGVLNFHHPDAKTKEQRLEEEKEKAEAGEAVKTAEAAAAEG